MKALIDLGGEGDRGEDGCDCEGVSHECFDEDNIFCIILLKRSAIYTILPIMKTSNNLTDED